MKEISVRKSRRRRKRKTTTTKKKKKKMARDIEILFAVYLVTRVTESVVFKNKLKGPTIYNNMIFLNVFARKVDHFISIALVKT